MVQGTIEQRASNGLHKLVAKTEYLIWIWAWLFDVWTVLWTMIVMLYSPYTCELISISKERVNVTMYKFQNKGKETFIEIIVKQTLETEFLIDFSSTNMTKFQEFLDPFLNQTQTTGPSQDQDCAKNHLRSKTFTMSPNM
jgi:hypothetical protein